MPKKKVVPEEKKELIDDEASLAIEAKFSIVEIKMKNDWRWKVKMLVHEILPRTHHNYSVKLIFDEEPYLENIEMLEREAKEISDNPSLLPDIDARSIRAVDKRIAKVRKDMTDMRNLCKDIIFVTQTEEIKYNGGDTSLVFRVLDTVVQPLNEQKYRLSEYKAVMEPIYR